MDQAVVPDVSVPLKSAVDLFIGFGTDFFAFIVLAALVAAFAFYLGSDRLSALIGAVYAAIPLYLAFPYRDALPENPWVSLGVFVAFTALGVIAFSGLSYFMASTSVGFIRVLALSVITAGFVIAVAIHVLPVEDIYTFSEPTKALFTSDTAYFWWLAAPLAGLFFLGRT
ncbi:MAG: hypothetical protein AAB923_00995 [Patescibacteria group bacterium]